MHTISSNTSDLNNRIPHMLGLASQSGPTSAIRKSSVLSREELQRLIQDMVG